MKPFNYVFTERGAYEYERVLSEYVNGQHLVGYRLKPIDGGDVEKYEVYFTQYDGKHETKPKETHTTKSFVDALQIASSLYSNAPSFS